MGVKIPKLIFGESSSSINSASKNIYFPLRLPIINYFFRPQTSKSVDTACSPPSPSLPSERRAAAPIAGQKRRRESERGGGGELDCIPKREESPFRRDRARKEGTLVSLLCPIPARTGGEERNPSPTILLPTPQKISRRRRRFSPSPIPTHFRGIQWAHQVSCRAALTGCGHKRKRDYLSKVRTGVNHTNESENKGKRRASTTEERRGEEKILALGEEGRGSFSLRCVLCAPPRACVLIRLKCVGFGCAKNGEIFNIATVNML